MKKFFVIMAMAAAMVFAQSCKDNESLKWQGVIDVTANGIVEGTFPTGSFSVNGNGAVNVNTANWGASENALSLADAANSNDAEARAAAEEVSAFFNITKAEGEYHALFRGVVKYGPFEFSVEEEFPKDTTVVSAVADTVDTTE